MISTIDILSALSDDKALILFNTIALGKCYDFKSLIKRMGITQSQYYFRLRRISNMGLVKREKGKYIATTLGNVVYEAVSMVGKALNYYWALNAIESFLSSSPAADSMEDKSMLTSMLIDNLIDDNQLKKILTNTPTASTS
jgi:DNA-binding transcriptional ArsR family regulator